MSILVSDLRRSCTFCRQRKMKCTGESPWCKACKERSQPCIYEASSNTSKSRTRRAPEKPITYVPPALEYARSLPEFMGTTFQHVGDVLDGLYAALWAPRGIAALRYEEVRQEARVGHDSALNTLPFEGAMMLMFYETAEMLVEKLSPLGRAGDAEPQQSRLLVALASDDTTTMFDDASIVERNGTDLACQLDQHRTTDLVELAFAEHPFLSIVCSKTLFLREYQAETHNECLLLVMLGEAFSILESRYPTGLKSVKVLDQTIAPEAYIDRALEMLRGQKRRHPGDHSHLSTLQAIVLLGWHMLYTGKIKRCFVLFGLATDMIRGTLAEREFDPTTSSRVNGIPTDDIEEELLYSMHWIVQTATLWGGLHLGVAISDLWGPIMQGFYPPLDLDSSKVWMLDAISGSLASARMQSLAVTKVRILSHGYGLSSSIFTIIRKDDQLKGPTTERVRSVAVTELLHTCLPRIMEEAKSALPAAHQAQEGYMAVQTYHELVALRILFEVPTMRDFAGWPPGTVVSAQMVHSVIEICRSLALQAEGISSGGLVAAVAEQSDTRHRLRNREELLYSTSVNAPAWCTALVVLAIDTAARVLEALLVGAGVIASTGVLRHSVESHYYMDESIQKLICGEVSKMAWMILRYYECLRSPSFECKLRRDVRLHVKLLVQALEERSRREHEASLTAQRLTPGSSADAPQRPVQRLQPAGSYDDAQPPHVLMTPKTPLMDHRAFGITMQRQGKWGERQDMEEGKFNPGLDVPQRHQLNGATADPSPSLSFERSRSISDVVPSAGYSNPSEYRGVASRPAREIQEVQHIQHGPAAHQAAHVHTVSRPADPMTLASISGSHANAGAPKDSFGQRACVGGVASVGPRSDGVAAGVGDSTTWRASERGGGVEGRLAATLPSDSPSVHNLSFNGSFNNSSQDSANSSSGGYHSSLVHIDADHGSAYHYAQASNFDRSRPLYAGDSGAGVFAAGNETAEGAPLSSTQVSFAAAAASECSQHTDPRSAVAASEQRSAYEYDYPMYDVPHDQLVDAQRDYGRHGHGGSGGSKYGMPASQQQQPQQQPQQYNGVGSWTVRTAG